MNGWRSRLLLGLLFYSVGWAHDEIAYPWPNTREWMLAYHGSASMLDLLLLFACGKLASGKLCDDMQVFCLLSIIINFSGWILYLAYVPPATYNLLMAAVTYVQFIRLLLVDSRYDSDVNPMGLHLVRSRYWLGAESHHKEAH